MYVALRNKQVAGMPGSDTGRVGIKAEQLVLRCINFKVRYQAFNVAKISNSAAIRYLGCVGKVGSLQVKVVILIIFRI